MPRKKIPDEDRKALRQKLSQIGGSGPDDTSDHRQRVEALNTTLPHSIKPIETRPRDRSDCMEYALGIPSGLLNLAATLKIDKEFATSGLPEFPENIPESETFDGQVVLYFANGETTHVGLMKGDRVISKWGKNPAYEHAIPEVPASYGDEYEIYKRPSSCYITKKFIEFVIQHPRYVDIRDTFENFAADMAI